VTASAASPSDGGESPTARESAVSRVVGQIRDMLRTREIVPGQQLRQEHLAARLGVSRVPVREALKVLETEGMLRHVPNVGYSVIRLSADELRQTYLMRRALETEVLRAMPRLTAEQVRLLTAINDEIAEAVVVADIPGISALNQRFHFTMFEMSGLDLVVAEIRRLWAMSDPYRTVHLYDQESRKRVVREHRRMLAALRRGDNAAVVDLMEEHRTTTMRDLDAALGLQTPGTTPHA
jgi:DNA-binding GntR family transcriptional regulator